MESRNTTWQRKCTMGEKGENPPSSSKITAE